MKSLIDKFITNEVLIAIFILVLAALIVMLPTYLRGKYSEQVYLENILLEAHGMIFDLIVIGVLSTWLVKRGQKRQMIQHYQDEIDDFRNWESDEAAHKILGNIKRLNKMKVTKIDLSYCYLRNIRLKAVNLEKSELYKIDLSNSSLIQSNFNGASMTESNLQNTQLRFSSFKESRLGYANLENSDLRDVDLGGADLFKANLKNANLRGANLRVARSITIKQLIQVKTLHMANLDSHYKTELMKLKPELFDKPED
jgi:BTB/POZ domain-containing protein KCTD9